MPVSIYYDGDCPVCANYVHFLRLKKASGDVELVDLRLDEAARHRFEAEGYVVDEGMIVETGGKTFAGADAMHVLAMMSTPSGIFNRLNNWLFRHKWLSQVSYPFLRAGRNLLLIILGRDPIAAENPEMMAKFRLFMIVFAFFTIFHVFGYTWDYGISSNSGDLILLAGVAGLSLIYNGSRRLFLLLIAVSLISGWLQAPVGSNHTLLRNYIALSFALTFIIDLVRGKSWSKTFADFAPVGGAGLLVMYFFGVFHKINTGFLDPEMSCAVTLWRQMIFYHPIIDNSFIHYMTIYGTLVGETILAIALLVPRWRHFGVVGGILFHMLLALSAYKMYLPFTTLSIAAHMLFVSPSGAKAIMNGSLLQQFVQPAQRRKLVVLGLIFFGLIAFLASQRSFSLVTISALALLLPLLISIIRLGRVIEPNPMLSGKLAYIATIILGTLFFANGLAPYFGVKSGQSFNMFANLNTAGGKSNHLIFKEPIALLPNLDKVVTIDSAENHPYLEILRKLEVGLVYRDFLNHLTKEPEALVSYTINGQKFTDQTVETLASEIEKHKGNILTQKFLVFRHVLPMDPPRCL